MDEELTPPTPFIGTAVTASLSMLLMWIAHPPLSADLTWLALLGWIAPLPLLSLVHRELPMHRRDYLAIWVAATFFWIAFMCGLRNAHPALLPGWLALSMYLACFIPLFVGLTRVAVTQFRVPMLIASPCVWVGLELIRGYAFSGFSAGMLAHSQARFPLVIQIADIAGPYAVSFVMMLFVTAIAQFRHLQFMQSDQLMQVGAARKWVTLGIGISGLILSLAYGQWRIEQANELADAKPLLTAALIQRNVPVAFEYSAARERETEAEYVRGSLDAMRAHQDIQLVVWPESSFTAGNPMREVTDDFRPRADLGYSEAEARAAISDWQEMFRIRSEDIQLALGAAAGRQDFPTMIVGCGVLRHTKDLTHAFSGAVQITPESKVPAWYGKRHLVMFGEFIPFANYFPWLYEVTPLSMGTTPGDAPIIMEVDGVSIAPNICFETMVEHVTGDHLRQLIANGEAPDLIVNLTNDAWFGNSAILDHHRNCTHLIAVAHRMPIIMAANGGPTMWIDGSGRLLGSIEHGVNDFVLATPTADPRSSIYLRTGDWTVWPMGCFCAVLAAGGWRTKRRLARERLASAEAHKPEAT